MAGSPPNPLTGDQYRQMVATGARYVEKHADEINALNVFPVPDGDTGINMLLTLRAANESAELPPIGTGTVAEVSAALSRGALLGARGNSGVIFSQFMKGIAEGLAGAETCDGADMVTALTAAAAAGYQAVGTPVEGTMLTVMRGAAEGVAGVTGSNAEVLAKALDAASVALAYTPEQLPILKEAGVVDAGGQGVVAFLAGSLAYVTGEDVPLEITAPLGGMAGANVSQAFLEHTEDDMYGFCTQFVVLGEGLDVDAVREQVGAMAASTVVIGDDRTVRVHAHAENPGPLLSLGVSLGSVDQINIQNMDVQHQQFMALHGYTQDERSALAVVAVAPGDGLMRLFRDQGATQVVGGGQTMNPSSAQLLDAIKRANAGHTYLLPNNPNIILAANQAAELTGDSVTVIPSRNIPQGIAAMLAFNPDLDAEANAAAMESALTDVQSGEVTTAVRSTTLNGVSIVEGQAIALLDGVVVAATATPNDALIAMLAGAELEAGNLVTLYWGADTPGRIASEAAGAIEARFPGVEVDILEGGQPHYTYLVSIE
ncbi:MAG: DAK2 domain-containing protein [Chloroflexi bacterium]|nr:DAK2 domain-containing protein [Chloroflexota bacterium]MDA1173468.1 DAK2 domain-containing protein [Chloroflexota bacterium]